MGEVLRHEHKYFLQGVQAAQCEAYIRALLAADPHNGPDGYTVRSLYFDTHLERDYFEKMGGYGQRQKLRLRAYGPNAATAQLEIKQKQGQDQRKRSITILRKDAEALARGDYRPLRDYGGELAKELYARLTAEGYQPRVVVAYRRRAYTLPTGDLRVTFDRDVRASEANFNLFAEPFFGGPALPPFHTILEVKYNGVLPSYVHRALGACGESETAYSKYCAGRFASLHGAAY